MPVATVEAAAKVLDLRTLPLPKDATGAEQREVGTVSYQTATDPKSAFEFHRQQLNKLGWKELAGTMAEKEYAHGMFSRNGFTAYVSSSPFEQSGKNQSSHVTIGNLGNVELSSLPILKGAKLMYGGAASVNYITDENVETAATNFRKLLLESGWEHYGMNFDANDQRFFDVKKNAIKISAMVSVAPAEENRTMIMFSSTLLAADIPAPPDADAVRFSGYDKSLLFTSSKEFPSIAKFYVDKLGKSGWKPTTIELTTGLDDIDRQTGTQVYRNEGGDVMTLKLTKAGDAETSVVVTHMTQQEWTDAESRLREAAKELVAERESSAKPAEKMEDETIGAGVPDFDSLIQAELSKALRGVPGTSGKPQKSSPKAEDSTIVRVPAGIKVNQTNNNVLQIKASAGKGLTTAEFISGHLKADGWESDDAKMFKSSGNQSFTRDNGTISLSYVDTGFGDITVMLIGIGTNLAAEATDAPAKVAASSRPGRRSTNARNVETEKEMAEEDTADEDSVATSKNGRRPADPERIDRPKKGIAKMPMLPTNGTARMGDKKFDLNNVIAYEIISANEWRTRIVATSKPVKQEKLISLLQETGADEDMKFPEPNVRLEIDANGEVAAVSYVLDGVSGSSNTELKGEVLIEDGRARGTLTPKEEGSFFDRTNTWDISFDTTVLTGDSKPVALVSNLQKLENVGELKIGTSKWKLSHVVAYETKFLDEVVTKVFVSEKPIDLEKLKASLAKDGTDDGLSEFQPQMVLSINDNDLFQQVAIYADGVSLNTNENLEGDVVITNGRVRGTAMLSKPDEAFGKEYMFKASFDTDVIRLEEP